MQFEFDASSAPQTSNDFEPLPAGTYTATVTGCEVKQTKAGDGQYLRVEYTISGPSGAGRKVWSNYNVRNANPKAEEIGRSALAELCRAVGKARLGDTDELVGCAVSIKLKIREASNGYEAQNEVKGHRAIDGAAPPPVSKGSAPAAAPKAAPPWAKK